MKSLQKFSNSKLGKIFAVVMTVLCIGSMFLVGASAETVTVNNITADEAIDAAEGLFGTITGTLNFTNIAKVLGIGLAAVIGIWLAWWGVRKLTKMITKALTKGKLSL